MSNEVIVTIESAIIEEDSRGDDIVVKESLLSIGNVEGVVVTVKESVNDS